MKQPLRIGLVLDHRCVASWYYVMLEQLLQAHYARIVVIIERTAVNSATTAPIDKRPSLLYTLYAKLDERFFACGPNAYTVKDSSTLLSTVPKLCLQDTVTGTDASITPEDMGRLQHYQLDLLLHLGSQPLPQELGHTARYGVWFYQFGDEQRATAVPPGFMEVMEGHEEATVSVQMVQGNACRQMTLFRSISGIKKFSVHKNKNPIAWKAAAFVPRLLAQLYAQGADCFFQRIAQQNQHPSFYLGPAYPTAPLSTWSMLKYLVRFGWRFLWMGLTYLRWLEQWMILFHLQPGMTTAFGRFIPLLPPKDRLWADPHVVHHQEKYYIFIEDLPYRTGVGYISVITIDETGNYQAPVKVLERPYHLSYPFVFQWQDHYYMIPESAQNRTIELYRCVEFPHKWELHMTLMADVIAYDATLFYYNHKWWLFTNLMEHAGGADRDELFLFYADDFQTNQWQPHPLNPIVSDMKRARPAGAIFEQNGNLYRPSQNSLYYYGYGLKFNQILVLSETDYQEVEVSAIDPVWDKRIRGVHTFNHTGQLTCIDALVNRRRWLPG